MFVYTFTSFLSAMHIKLLLIIHFIKQAACSFCKKLKEPLGESNKCTEIIGGFQLTSASGCLSFGGFSFDPINSGAGSISPQNVCRLAFYGNNAKSYTLPNEVMPTSYAVVSETLQMAHWFGRCASGACPFCTNDKLLRPGQDFTKFSVGGSCGGSNTKAAVSSYF